MLKNKPSQIFSWAMFDFANTSFTIVVITVIFPLYFKNEIIDFVSFEFLGITFHNPYDFFWGLASSLSFLVVALTAPVLGALSDETSQKKIYILFYSILCVVATSLIPFLDKGDIFFSICLIVLGNIGFETGIVYYDAFLPVIATRDKYSLYSGYGFAAGYVGAIVSLIIALQFISNNVINPMVFVASSLFFLFFSFPFFFFVKEKKKERIITFTKSLQISVQKVKTTLSSFDKYPAVKWFILAFFFYINGVLTMITFGGIYASNTLGLTTEDVILFFVLVQSSAVLGSFAFGYLGKRIGEFRSLNYVLFIWIVVCLLSFLASFVSFKLIFFSIVGIFAGIALGSIQALSRSYFSKMIEEEQEAEFFGFYALSGRFAAILGPFVFGLVSALTGRQEYSVLTIIIFFIVGKVILSKVPQALSQKSI